LIVVDGWTGWNTDIKDCVSVKCNEFKGKGPIIEENTIDEAIDVDEYLSEEEGSEYSIEDQDDNGDAGASTSGIEVEGIPSKLGFYVVNNFDQNTMEIKLDNGSLLITMELIADMIGIINKGVDIWAENVVKDAVKTKNWLDQYGGIKNINQNHVKHVIRNLRIVDMNFKLNFIVLFTSMMYVDGTICKDFRVGRKRPPTTMWTKELLKERELAEIKAGGLGKGELEGPYVEEQDDLKTNLTFDVAKEMFPGNTIFDDLERCFIESLQYQKEENAEIGRARVHTEDATTASEGQEQSTEAGDRIGSGLDSPRQTEF
ncbi:hypothetical protein Tco_1281175, partial [Tanacetum coccineum]